MLRKLLQRLKGPGQEQGHDGAPQIDNTVLTTQPEAVTTPVVVPHDAVCIVATQKRTSRPPSKAGGAAATHGGGGGGIVAALLDRGVAWPAQHTQQHTQQQTYHPHHQQPQKPRRLEDLPDAALELIWAHLGACAADRAALRLAAPRVFACVLNRATLSPGDMPAARGLGARLPALTELVIRLPPAGNSGSGDDVQRLRGFARDASAKGELGRTQTLSVEGRVRGHALTIVCRLAAATPSLRRLLLPGLRTVQGHSGGGSSRRTSDSGNETCRISMRRISDSSVIGSSHAGSSKKHHRSSDCSNRTHRRISEPDGGPYADNSSSSSSSRVRRHRTSDSANSVDDGDAAPPAGDKAAAAAAAAEAAAREEAYLCGMLDALPALTELDLGGPRFSNSGGGGGCAGLCNDSTSGSFSGSGGGYAPLPPAVLGRVARLRRLTALSVDASAVRDGRCAAALLADLTALRRLALRASAPANGAGGQAELARAICALPRLERLSLEADELGAEFVGALDARRHLARLEWLELAMCSQLPVDAVAQLSQLPRLARLTLPFSLDADALRALSRSPALSELFTRGHVDLRGAAPPPDGEGTSILALPPATLRGVTSLAAAALVITDDDSAAAIYAAAASPRRELGAVFPALRALRFARASDAELALAAGVGARLEALSVHSAPRASDAGLALLGAACRGLVRLSLADAPHLTDEGFARMFASPAPALAHLELHRLPSLTDRGMVAVTAAVRRLAAASLSACPELSDRTLSRMGRMDALARAHVARLRQVTADGVRALAGAPAMRSVEVAWCPGVRAAGCRPHRRAVRVRVDDEDV